MFKRYPTFIQLFICDREISVIIPEKVIRMFDDSAIGIENYLEIFEQAFDARNNVAFIYSKRLIASQKYSEYLAEYILSCNSSPEEIQANIDEFIYDEFLQLFEEMGHPMGWYRLHSSKF